MCGICGFCGREENPVFANSEMTENIRSMMDSLIHRGPDDGDSWIDSRRQIAFGHRRLSIIDLSAKGRQPMISASGRFVITFNGEIYNYPELMKDLQAKGVVFKSNCDTEVLLELIGYYGIEEAIRKTEGMFALSVYDKEMNCLYLVRDRMGEKPLYYGWSNGVFVFASELKAIKTLSFFHPVIDGRAVYLFLKYRFIKSPLSIYKDIYKLPAGSICRVDLNARAEKIWKYWSLEDVAKDGVEKRKQIITLDEATDRLDDCLTGIIRRQMRSDVPLGLFLSSGIDSSIVAALAQKQSLKSISTFTIGTADKEFNEADEARKIASHLKTNHNELYVTSKETAELLPEMIKTYDEPYAQPSSLPMYLVSKLAKKHVTVCLAGDGGDELFVGYHRICQKTRIWEEMLLSGGNPRFSDFFDFYLYRVYKNKIFKDSLLKIPPIEKRYFRQFATDQLPTFLDMACYFECLYFLEGDTLVKVDRASMAHALEVREPFLSHKAVELALSLPAECKYNDIDGHKVILKKLLGRYLPRPLWDIPKKGFNIPLFRWLFGECFRDILEWCFDKKNLECSGFLDAGAYSILYEKAKSNLILGEDSEIFGETIYTVLIFQLWLKKEGILS